MWLPSIIQHEPILFNAHHTAMACVIHYAADLLLANYSMHELPHDYKRKFSNLHCQFIKDYSITL